MDFNTYQKESRKTAIYPKIGHEIVYPALGLAGESGEVVEKIKKLFRNDNGVISDEAKIELAKELGDVIWYVSQIATELGISMEEVVQMNLLKLKKRMTEGTIASSGDNR